MTMVYPPSHPLASASAKVKRANVHIKALSKSIRHARDPQVAFGVKGKLEGPPRAALNGMQLYDLSVTPNTRNTWGQIIGDVVTNLRSSLDHVAWALAQKSATDKQISLDPGQERAIYFPIREEPGKFQLNYRVPAGAKDVIESFQPYDRADRPELELLGVLDELARLDKHRIAIAASRQVSVYLGPGQPVTFISLNNPASQGFFVPRGQPDYLEPYFTFDEVIYPAGGNPWGFSVSKLALIHDLIRDEVLPAFGGFFL